MSRLRGLTLTVRFGCELALLAALAWWGFSVGDGVGAWLLGLGAPLLAAIVWGALVAPNARWPLPPPARVVVELLPARFAAPAASSAAGEPAPAVALTTSSPSAAASGNGTSRTPGSACRHSA